MQSVGPPAVAGTFYRGDKATLASAVSDLLATAAAELPRQSEPAPPKALFAPRGGYSYSGGMAARAFYRLAPWHQIVPRVSIVVGA